MIHGDDATIALSGDERRWRQIVASCPHSWADDEFPATQLSIDGKEAAPNTAPAPGVVPSCSCRTAAKKSTVTSPTPNKGRAYYHCGAPCALRLARATISLLLLTHAVCVPPQRRASAGFLRGRMGDRTVLALRPKGRSHGSASRRSRSSRTPASQLLICGRAASAIAGSCPLSRWWPSGTTLSRGSSRTPLSTTPAATPCGSSSMASGPRSSSTTGCRSSEARGAVSSPTHAIPTATRAPWMALRDWLYRSRSRV